MHEISIPRPVVDEHVRRYLLEDLTPLDITTSQTPCYQVEARIIAKNSGVLAGISFIPHIFGLLGPVEVTSRRMDGDVLNPEDEVIRLCGESRILLAGERLALNILMRTSGIATLTSKFNQMIREKNSHTRIAATRKTTPGFRIFEKYGVAIGGGDTHRWDLGDSILIKNNHIFVFGGLEKAISTLKSKSSFTAKIEVEVRTVEEAIVAAQSGADIVMLDNFSPESVEEAINVIEKTKTKDTVIFEASGNITLENVGKYAETGVDVISVGMLTHSYPSLDFSMEIYKVYT